MICCFAFAHCDAELALKNALWMAQLKISKSHEALAICNIEARDRKLHEPVIEALRKTFSRVHVGFCTEDERLWPDEQRKWPWVQNLTFSSAARYVRDHLRSPWLFQEADAIPVCDGWLDQIEGEYHYSRQPFMGMLVDTVSDNGQRIPAHMSGIAVYPPDLSKWTDKALQGGGVAFDMILRDATVTNMHQTRLIHHVYRAESFPDAASLDRVHQGAVLFHQNKDGTLIDRLCERTGTPLSAPSATIPSAPATPTSSPKTMTTDIFIKTYPKDYEWLKYCLRSIERFATGFRRVVLITPQQIELPESRIPVAQFVVPDQEPGYLFQQSVKLHAYRWSDADQFLFMDCDCVFTRPVTPDTFMVDSKPIWIKTPWKDVGDINARDAWIPAMREWFGATPQYEYMRRHPFLIPRFLLDAMLQHTHFMHAKPLDEYIMSAGGFSEFNCAGYLADKKFQNRFHWIDTSKQPLPELAVHQFYSHAGITDGDKNTLEVLLKPQIPEGIEQMRAIIAGTEKPENMEIPMPILFRHSDPITIHSAIAFLKEESESGSLHKARVVAALVKAGIVYAKEKPAKKRGKPMRRKVAAV